MKLELRKGYWMLFIGSDAEGWKPLVSFTSLADAVIKVPEAEVIL